MGRAVDFAKRRIAGYIVFWIVVLFVLYVLYQGRQLNPASGFLILIFAFVVSLAYTGRMKRKQRRTQEERDR